MTRQHSIIGALLLTMLLAIACDPMTDLCYDPNPIHYGSLRTRFAWPAKVAKPDSMTILCLRPINQYKAGLRVPNTSDFTSRGVRLFAEPENDTIIDRLRLPEGEYDLFGYNALDGVYSSSTEEFRNDPHCGLESMRIYLNTYESLLDMPEQAGAARYEDWFDTNPYSGYVAPSAVNLMCGSVRACKIMRNRTTDATFNVLTDLTQQITFRVRVKRLESGITIDSVKAEVSGIPAAVRPLTGCVEVSPSYRIVFPFEREDGSVEQSGTVFSHTVGLLGIIPNGLEGIVINGHKALPITGPGIMHVCIYTTYEETYTDSKGETYTKAYRHPMHAVVNMKSVLERVKLLTHDKETDEWYQRVKQATIEISTPIEITRKRVMDTHNGVEDWVGVPDPIDLG